MMGPPVKRLYGSKIAALANGEKDGIAIDDGRTYRYLFNPKVEVIRRHLAVVPKFQGLDPGADHLACRVHQEREVKDQDTWDEAGVSGYLQLVKARIAAFASLSAAAGFLLARPVLSPDAAILPPALGTLLLTMGACALNQVQDRVVDSRMERTRKRPIPSGTIGPGRALSVATGLAVAGLVVLGAGDGTAVVGLGVLGVIWYNGLYAYLKRTTAFAAVPGAVVGAIPPAIGWLAAGGKITDPPLLALALFFFLWQAPHFWLLFLSWGEDYEKARLPLPTGRLGIRQMSHVVYAWISATAAAAFLMPLCGLVTVRLVAELLAVSAIGLLVATAKLVRPSGVADGGLWRAALHRLNAYVATAVGLLLLDRLLCSCCMPRGVLRFLW